MAIQHIAIGTLDWGDEVNDNFADLDTRVTAAQAEASDANSNATLALATANTAAANADQAIADAADALNVAQSRETTLGAQNKANAAQAAAEAYADTQDALLETRIADLELADEEDWEKTVDLPDSGTQYRQVNIPDDGSPTSGWPDRLAFFFNGVRTGYFNEYGEFRARPGKTNTVALRAMAHSSGSSGNIFEVGPSTQPSTPYFRVSQTIAEATVPLSTTQYLVVGGDARRVYVDDTDPGASAPDGSFWIRPV